MVDRSGQQLGNYLLTRPLGQGGFAEVYLGQHIYLKTQAAIKVLLTQLSGDDMEEFLNEARTIANLIHPNIVRVLDFGVQNTTPFLVMDYAPNGTLRQRHPKGSRLKAAVIVSYIKQIATGLQYAHDQKLIHRDIKPENLLVGRNNEILLSDFGIALVAQSSRYQSTQDVVGTVAYMSPEQIQGKPRPASDQYSLGIVVYEWLSGNRPFHGSFTELCTQHMFASPPPLRERVPLISTEIEQVANTALAKVPKQRFGSVQAFAKALEQASQNQEQIATLLKPQPTPPPNIAVPTPQPTPPSYSSIAPSPSPNRAAYPATQQAYQQPVAQAPATKVKVWSIDKRRIRAAIIGATLFICLGRLLSWVVLPNTSLPFFVLYYVEIPAILLVITIFFGEVFGPWVGLFVGGIGYFLYFIVERTYSFPSNYTPFGYTYYTIFGYTYPYIGCITFALVGFIAGFVLLITNGRYNNFRAIAVATTTGIIISILFGFLLFWIDVIPYEGVILILPLVCLILLPIRPILLVSYNAIISRRKRA